MSMQNMKLFFLLAMASLTISLGCTKKSVDSTVVMIPSAGELNLAIWSNYLSPEMAKKFTEQTGIKLNISNYASNEDLMAKIQTGAAGIDVAVPSDYLVTILAKEGKLQELQRTLIPNFTNLSAELLGQDSDPENRFSLPYSWTTTGIAINRELYKGKIESWKDVLENDQLKGKISLLDDIREVAGLALKKQGISLNTTDEKEIKKAKDYLMKIKKNIKLFQSDSIDLLTNKEVVVAQAYSSDALNAWNKSGGKIEYVLPKEGSTRAIDNLVILKGSKNIEGAHKLINFLLSQEANVNFVSTMFGGPVLSGTRELLEPKLKNNEALFPSKESMKNLEAVHDLGDKTALYDDLWTAVKTAN